MNWLSASGLSSRGLTYITTHLVIGIQELLGFIIIHSITHEPLPLVSDGHSSNTKGRDSYCPLARPPSLGICKKYLRPHLGARSLYLPNSDLGSGAGAKISAIPRFPSPEGVYEEDSVGICLDGAISVCLFVVERIVVDEC